MSDYEHTVKYYPYVKSFLDNGFTLRLPINNVSYLLTHIKTGAIVSIHHNKKGIPFIFNASTLKRALDGDARLGVALDLIFSGVHLDENVHALTGEIYEEDCDGMAKLIYNIITYISQQDKASMYNLSEEEKTLIRLKFY